MRYYWLLVLFISLLLSGCNKNPEDEKSSVVTSETVKPSQASAIEAVVLKKGFLLRLSQVLSIELTCLDSTIHQINPRA
jgi:hypothetical protein